MKMNPLVPRFRFLSAWFCPYAHRATIALEFFKQQDRLDYEWIEALGWKEQTTINNNSDDNYNNIDNSVTTTKEKPQESEWYYHWKADELVRVNPSALVPTIIPLDTMTNQPLEHQAVYESLVCVDYIDHIVRATSVNDVGGKSKLTQIVPDDSYDMARCRIWADKVNRECCSPY
jgi:glutathione S-transferase